MLEIGKLGDDVSGVLFDQLRVAFSFSWKGRSFIAKVPHIFIVVPSLIEYMTRY